MFQKKTLFFVAAIYLFVTTALYLFSNMHSLSSPLTFFFNDPTIEEKIHAQTTYDTGNVYITRFFHNKPQAYLETFSLSVYRSIDPLSLFSFDTKKSPILFPIEFPVFLFAVWHLIRRWDSAKKGYRFLIPIGIGAVLVTGLFLPAGNPLVLFPLAIYLRVLIVLGILVYLQKK